MDAISSLCRVLHISSHLTVDATAKLKEHESVYGQGEYIIYTCKNI